MKIHTKNIALQGNALSCTILRMIIIVASKRYVFACVSYLTWDYQLSILIYQFTPIGECKTRHNTFMVTKPSSWDKNQNSMGKNTHFYS